MKLVTKDTGYALRILLYMAENRCRSVSVGEIINNVNIPRAFSRRICQVLSNKKILSSRKGKGGGFMLCRRPEVISVKEIIGIFQGKIEFLDCFLKGHLCSRIKKCPVRRKLKVIEKEVEDKLNKITIKELLEGK